MSQGFVGPIAGRQGRFLLDRAGGHRALHADGRSRRRRDQDRDAGGRRRLAPHDRAARHAQHLLRDQQSRREERHAQPEVAGGPRHPAQAGRQGRHLRPELPARRGRQERLRLGGAAQGQPQAGLCLDLGLRHARPQRPSARHRFDGAGAGRHRRGLFHAGPEDAHRHRLGGRRIDRHAGLRRRAGGAHPCAHHRRRPEDRAVAAGLAGAPDGLDLHHDDVAQQESGDRPGPHHRHARAAGHQRLVQRPRRQAAGLPAHRPGELEGRHDGPGLLRPHQGGGLRESRRDHRQRRQARGAAGAARRSVRHRHARRLGGAGCARPTSSRRRSTRCWKRRTIPT